MQREDFWNHPPKYLENSLDPAWILEVVKGDSTCDVHCHPLTDAGGLMSTLFKVTVTFPSGPKSYVLKQIVTEQQRQTSRNLKLSREAYFYQSEISKEIGGSGLIAGCVYSHANEETGEKYVMLEDVGKALQAGFFYGPGNPNNWKKKDELPEMCAPYLAYGVDIDVVTREAFRLSARIHAKYWMKPDVLSVSWLRGREWWLQQDAESWHMSQNSVKAAWAKKLETDSHGLADEYLFKLVDASVNKISLEDYHAWTKRTQWTLVHGDFHPANLMWVDAINSLKFLDWEMIGVGSGAQELGQYLISHMEPAKRKACELDLLRLYYDELTAHGVCKQAYTFENCRDDYVRGASERWMWFLAYLSFPAPMTNYFAEQVAAFCRDHNVTCESIGQVRP